MTAVVCPECRECVSSDGHGDDCSRRNRFCEREACVNHHIRKEGFWVHDNGDGAYRLGPKKGRSAVRGVRAARMFANFMGGRVVHVIALTAKDEGTT